MIAEEVPYGYIDLSNVDLSNNDLSKIDPSDSIPISVEVVPHKVYLIDEPQSIQSHSIHSTNGGHSYLNFQIFRLSENRNRQIDIETGTVIERNNQIIQRIKCIFYTLISIPITIILLGYVSIAWERA